MRLRLQRSITLLLALLLAASSCFPTPGRAEAQMRCVGASPQSRPCARVELPAAGLTERQVYDALMPCCRAMHTPCGMMRDSLHPVQDKAERQTRLAARCLVSVRVTAVPTPQAVRRARWLLYAAPALAPPQAAPTVSLPAQTIQSIFWTYSPVLSPHAAPHLRGLRAPPTA